MTADTPAAAGRLADNVLHFCRLLRAAGLPVGPGRVLDAARAAALAGVRRRDDLYWTLHASLVARRDCKPVFDRAFDAFWGLPESTDAQDATAAPLTADRVERAAAGQRRVDEAMRLRGPEEPPENRLVADATATASAREALRVNRKWRLWVTLRAMEECIAFQYLLYKHKNLCILGITLQD